MGIGIFVCLFASRYGVIQYSSHFNIVWIEHFSKALSEGIFYPRWQTDYFDGLGAPSFYFYPALPFFILAPFWFLFSFIGQESFIFLAYGLIIGLSGITCYIAFRPLFGQKIAFICAIIYEILPYHLIVDVFDRGALSEITTYIWIPLCASLLLKGGLLHNSRHRLPVFILCYTALILSHLPLTIIISGFLCVLQILRFPNLRDTFKFIACVLCSFALASPYVIPALSLMDTIQTHVWMKAIYYKNFPFFAGDGSGICLNGLISFIYALYIIASITIILYLSLNCKEGDRKQIIAPLLVVMAGAVFLLSPLSLFIWELLPFMKFIQFPWRVLIIFDIAIVLLIGVWLKTGNGFYKKSFLALLIPIIIFIGLNVYYMPDRERAVNIEHIQEIIQYKMQHDYPSSEFITAKGDHPRNINFESNFRPNIKNSSLVKRTTDSFIFEIQKLEAPQTVELRQYDYIGWVAMIEERGETRALEIRSSHQGLIEMTLPAGDYRLTVKRTILFQEYIGYIFSLLGLLILFILWRFLPLE